MSVFLETNHLFLRNPRGGVEDVQNMKANGFGAIFCNVGDHEPAEWSVVRDRARAANVVCGPWLRTSDESNEFVPNKLLRLIEIADDWDAPYIVNSESELKGSGSDLTEYINRLCSQDEWALSMEPWPFANVDWTPVDAPVLPQCFGPEWGAKVAEVRSEWRRVGIRCVVPTYASYSGWGAVAVRPARALRRVHGRRLRQSVRDLEAGRRARAVRAALWIHPSDERR